MLGSVDTKVYWAIIDLFGGIISILLVFAIKPIRTKIKTIMENSEYVSELRNPDHKLYYMNVIAKADAVYKKHEQENLDIVKEYKAEAEERETEEAKFIKDSINSFNQKFEKIMDKFENLEQNLHENTEDIREMGDKLKSMTHTVAQVLDRQSRG